MALKVGIILYSVRDAMAEDGLGTVEKVAELGYKYVEVCNHNALRDSGCGFGIPADELEQTFKKFGTRVVSAHIFPFEKADMAAVLQYNRTLGNTNIVNPMGQFSTYDDLMRQCEEFNRIGKICHEEGMTYLYHNHEFEFRTIRGKMIMDYINENTDPQYLSFELDTFWVMRAALSPMDVIRQYGKRIKLIHQKDFAWDSLQPINLIGLTPEDRELKPGEVVGIDGNSDYAKNGKHKVTADRILRATSFTEIGSGIMPIQKIIDAANTYTDAEYIILEQDSTRMPTQLDSVAESMEGFKKFTGILWD